MGLFKPNVEKLKNVNDITGLKKCLTHRNSDVRYAAFNALADRTDQDNDTAAKLKSMLNDPSRKVRTAATFKYMDLTDKKTTENCREILNDGTQREKMDLLVIIAPGNKNPDINTGTAQIIALAMIDKNELVKIKAIQLAGETGSSRFVPNLLECLNDRLKFVRINAAEALYKIQGAGSIGYLVGLLVDPDSGVQETARSFISLMNSKDSRIALNDFKFQQLIRGLNDIESVRRETALKIGREEIKEGLPLLYTALKDDYMEVRIAALKAISAFKDPSSVNYVVRLLGDKYQNTRIEAARTLGQIISGDSLAALEIAMKKGDFNVRQEAQKSYNKLRSRGI
jgi:HEAT repeat protein